MLGFGPASTPSLSHGPCRIRAAPPFSLQAAKQLRECRALLTAANEALRYKSAKSGGPQSPLGKQAEERLNGRLEAEELAHKATKLVRSSVKQQAPQKAPRTLYDFRRNWHSLKHSEAARCQYLQVRVKCAWHC